MIYSLSPLEWCLAVLIGCLMLQAAVLGSFVGGWLERWKQRRAVTEKVGE